MLLNKYFSSIQQTEDSSHGSQVNGDNSIEDLPILEETSLMETMDPNLDLELETLKLEQLKLREEQLLCKHRMLLLKQTDKRSLHLNSPSNRCILPDGRIVVRNAVDRSTESRAADVSFSAGAGDSLKIPGLQRVGSRQCVRCGAQADSFCARCGVTPYCSARCQRRDWNDRHRAVCHNLARLPNDQEPIESTENQPAAPVTAPLRQPHSPKTKREQLQRENANNNHQTQNFLPPDHKPPARTNNRPMRGGGGGGQMNRGQDRARPPLRHEAKSIDADDSWDGEIPQPQPNVPRQPNAPSTSKQLQKHYTRNQSGSHAYLPPKSETVVPKPVPINSEIHTEVRTRNAKEVKAPNSKEDKTLNAREINTPNAKEVKTAPANEVKTPTAKEVKTTPADEIESLTVKQVQKPSVKEVTVDRSPNCEEVNVRTAPVQLAPSVSDATPVRKVIPRTYLISQLDVGEIVLLSVESKASECRTTKSGYVCLTMHEKFQTDYQHICEDYVVECEADTSEYTVVPGETFSYFNPDDGGWYRARCLNPNTAALLDGSKVVTLNPSDKCKKMPAKYETVPEFCCVLDAEGIEVGVNLKCTILSKTKDGYKLSLQEVDSDTIIGEGEVCRWVPTVEYSVPVKINAVSPRCAVPEVHRPPLVHKSRVLLVDAATTDRVVVRPAHLDHQKQFDSALQDVLLYASKATPLTEPPIKGQTVISEFTDGLHYRALCKRTNIKQNKYLIEYIEYGNIEITSLEKLYPCPPELDMMSVPTLASVVDLGITTALTPPATQLLDKLKEQEMILTLPSEDAKIADSGSVATLTVVKTNEVLNRTIETLCTPEWRIIENRGGDIFEVENIMYSELQWSELPSGECTFQILDVTELEMGAVNACVLGSPHAQFVFTQLIERMSQYCNSQIARDPYLPKPEEICIAQLPPNSQWLRAVFLEHENGPGDSMARLLYIDYGNIATVPVTAIRKMMPEFVKDLPVVAYHLDINDFPAKPTGEMLKRAHQYMKLNGEGRGELRVSRCVRQEEDGMYSVDAPALIQAMQIQ